MLYSLSDLASLEGRGGADYYAELSASDGARSTAGTISISRAGMLKCISMPRPAAAVPAVPTDFPSARR